MFDTESILSQLGHPRILVLGDAMLDRYTWGHAERVSPEAPVLVLRTDQREVRLGGAASVAVLLRALEVETTLASVIGDDHDGRTLRRLIDEADIYAGSLLIDLDRPTTVKERFLGRSVHHQPHQMLRVDTESRTPLANELTSQLIDALAVLVPQHAAVLISDYAKGVCTERLVAEVISMGRKAGVPVLIDPARGVDFAIYRGATLLKPNRLEAELAISHPIRSPKEARNAAKVLREQYEVEIVVITLDRDGLVFATAAGSEHRPIAPREICDITGAGDMVLATLGLGLTAGLKVSDAARLANLAAGLQVAQPGVTPILRATLLCAFREGESSAEPRIATNVGPTSKTYASISMPLLAATATNGTAKTKQVTFDTAQNLADEYRASGEKIVFTNGCFDLLHAGHIAMLEESSQLGDVLFVAINSDESVRRLKGKDRPIIPQQDRAGMLASLECVDYVLIFEEATPHTLLNAIRPDVLVKGGTTTDVIGREIVEAYGGQICQTQMKGNWSTTGLVRQMQSNR
jgi:D-beta-D-heptose 7-phosphate kinase/D-beta-D-heptose 1-phosphate adenosyltransferase